MPGPWNWSKHHSAIVNFNIYTCTCPTVACQNVFHIEGLNNVKLKFYHSGQESLTCCHIKIHKQAKRTSKHSPIMPMHGIKKCGANPELLLVQRVTTLKKSPPFFHNLALSLEVWADKKSCGNQVCSYKWQFMFCWFHLRKSTKNCKRIEEVKKKKTKSVI